MKINIENPIPLHVQIRDQIEKGIKNDAFDQKIPSERELMEIFSVSRTTIRKAVSALVNEGILMKVHGKGTFIANPAPIEEWLGSINSLTEIVEGSGMKASSKLLKSEIVEAPAHISKVFEQKEVYFIERLRYSNGIPIAIEKHFYTKELGNRLTQFDLNTATIYDLIENNLGITLYEAEQVISCKNVEGKEAERLAIEPASSVLSVERIITDEKENVIEYYSSLLRPDMYAFRIKNKRKLKY